MKSTFGYGSMISQAVVRSHVVKRAANAVEMDAFLWTQLALSARVLKRVFVNCQICAVGVFVWMGLIQCVACRLVKQPVPLRTAVPRHVNKFRELEKDICAKHVSMVRVISHWQLFCGTGNQ